MARITCEMVSLISLLLSLDILFIFGLRLAFSPRSTMFSTMACLSWKGNIETGKTMVYIHLVNLVMFLNEYIGLLKTILNFDVQFILHLCRLYIYFAFELCY